MCRMRQSVTSWTAVVCDPLMVRPRAAQWAELLWKCEGSMLKLEKRYLVYIGLQPDRMRSQPDHIGLQSGQHVEARAAVRRPGGARAPG
eukprot:scaffold101933_cov45-Phaeocystis_antarctica.AAC.2